MICKSSLYVGQTFGFAVFLLKVNLFGSILVWLLPLDYVWLLVSFLWEDEIELPARADVTFFRNSRSVSAGVGDHDYPVRNIANAQSENIQSQNLQIKYESNNNKKR